MTTDSSHKFCNLKKWQNIWKFREGHNSSLTWFFLRLWRFINHLLTYLLTYLFCPDISVHTGEEVEDGNVDDIEQTSAAVKRRVRTDVVTEVGLGLPGRQFVALRVELSPRVGPRLARHIVLGGEERRTRAFDHIRAATDGVMTVAVVLALGVETQVARWPTNQSYNQLNQSISHVYLKYGSTLVLL